MPAGIWFSNEFTIECWVYARSFNSYSRIIDFGNGAPLDNVILTLTDGTTGRPSLSAVRGTSSQGVEAPQALPLDQWVHVAATLRSNLATLYYAWSLVSGEPARSISLRQAATTAGLLGEGGVAHRAIEDARLTLECFRHYIARLAPREPAELPEPSA